jgi:hypothetical protein
MNNNNYKYKMFTISNTKTVNGSSSFSVKPKKENNNANNDYVKISNDTSEDDGYLSIDLNKINFENISVELALNVLQLKHNIYHEMNQYEIIKYYNEKMKLSNNLNIILALKIILKSKLKGLNIKIDKSNTISSSYVTQTPISNLKENDKKEFTALNKNISESNEFKIQQIQQTSKSNNFKIIQNTIQPIQFIQQNHQINHQQNYQANHQQNHQANHQQNHQANYQQNHQVNYQINNLSKSFNSNNVNVVNNANSVINDIRNNNNFNKNIRNYDNNIIKNNNEKETFKGIPVINSSEFDIDSIVKTHFEKKSKGLIK